VVNTREQPFYAPRPVASRIAGMTEAEVEQVVLDVVRRYTQNDSVAASSRFESDLRQGELSRQRLFALLAESFTARGVSLPAHGFMLSDFLNCPTPAAVRDTIRSRVFGAPAPAATKAAARSEAPAPAKADAKADSAKPAKKPAAKKPAAPKKSSGGAKSRRPSKRK
jgi:hypothetical protein